jgi:hypothetical protein
VGTGFSVIVLSSALTLYPTVGSLSHLNRSGEISQLVKYKGNRLYLDNNFPSSPSPQPSHQLGGGKRHFSRQLRDYLALMVALVYNTKSGLYWVEGGRELDMPE